MNAVPFSNIQPQDPYSYANQPLQQTQPENFFSKLGGLYTTIGAIFIMGGLLLLLVPAFPYLYYNINVEATNDEVSTLSELVTTKTSAKPTTITPTPSLTPTPLPLPAKDPSLPTKNTLVIPGIGVNGPINEGSDSKKALYKGIWRHPEWGTPLEDNRPTIIAAHRFGYIEWSQEFRKTQSFFNLPNMKVGDTFSVIWDQREFKYEVKRVEEANAIYTADSDMILYTCKYLKSPVRIIVYADRVN